MPREDEWVAVAPQFEGSGEPKIKPAQSAYSFWQKENTESVKAEHLASNNGKFEVGVFSRAMRDRWNSLDASEKEPYEDLALKDQFRFRSESHQADVAAIERRERLQMERETLLLDDVGGTQRGTRGQRAHNERKEKRKEKRRLKKMLKKKTGSDDDASDDEDYTEGKKRTVNADDQEFVDDDDESSEGGYSGSSDSDDSYRRTTKKPKVAPRKVSEKQLEIRRKAQEEKQRKEAIIAEQQEDIQKEKASQAKKRLEFLLKQSSIFSHFGQVKQDQAKFGIKTATKKSGDEGQGSSRRDQGNANQEEELEEADEHQATFLTAQPTTLGFGKMREYQLEGLNWMIRLQENGVNGILADEVSWG